jgi:hypothetical protein
MPLGSKAPARRVRMRTARAFWPLLLLLLVFAWRSTACKKKEQAIPGRKGAHTPITYHYPTPQPTYTFRPGAPAPTAQPE